MSKMEENQIQTPAPAMRQVWYNKELGFKGMIRSDQEIENIKNNPDNYIFVADTPHSEKTNELGGIFSYMCDNQYCRCHD